MFTSNNFSLNLAALATMFIAALLTAGVTQAAPATAVPAALERGAQLPGEQLLASGLELLAGAETGSTALLLNSRRPSPTFGSLNPATIDLAHTTLDVFDAVPIADRATADGFVATPDGRLFAAFLEPGVVEDGALLLAATAAARQPEEEEIVDTAILAGATPEPGTLVLLALGLASLVVARNRA
ncbi:PEP-CTERM sorting domain-containing protein [Exilibacterium tricleocarpae]|uniref:PEP-CTERM sorting domain-containing protein n=1 Tax=Exilibacterium tricleocarpae TaxID=2591008 RepID=A0A545TLK9_9GAMM|nr:PEP-CTERM sorting domain-containing protein [Exilibacterium tricleocarpae]TQV78120.1 PEP-CTERM sorting domain-containing protein [Exilibacterium tricleocarpae]